VRGTALAPTNGESCSKDLYNLFCLVLCAVGCTRSMVETDIEAPLDSLPDSLADHYPKRRESLFDFFIFILFLIKGFGIY
jgi:hypothetical protein